jgi:methyltransferase (TIGR00027 family)
MPGSANPIRHVSDTALWVAVYRAMESERPDAIFRDPYARRLAGERGEAIVRAMPKGRAMAWPMIVRTAVMDEIILRVVGQGAATVLNLAAGLDARAWRLPLPPPLTWFDVDLPDMIAYREEHLAGERPGCVHENVAADLTDAGQRAAAFSRVGAAAAPVLVVTEGLLVYLTAEQVAALARELHAQAAFRWWLIDLASPRLLAMLAKGWGKSLAAGNAPMQFAPPEGTKFFEPHGWREVEYRSAWEESFRLNRTMPLGQLWRFIGRLMSKKRQEAGRRMSGFVLLERT